VTDWHERTFPAMGASGHVLVHGPARLLDQAETRIEELEDRWSRFRPQSELSTLNRRRDGRPWRVTADTALLVQACVTAWRGTGGRFDPTMLDAVVALGYDRDFDLVRDAAAGSAAAPRPGHGLDGVVVDDAAGTVTLPADVRIDPGGLGKGLAADVVVAELLASGAQGALVNLGGDLAVDGTAPGDGGWSVSVDDPFAPGHALRDIRLVRGGVATSSTLMRRWRCGDDVMHHLLDPATGLPTRSGIAAATVVAGTAWWAEALATAIVVGGPCPLSGEAALIVTDDGNVHVAGDTDGVVTASAALVAQP
jgi:thiamine biosynthesis lipoprotein